MNRKRRSLGPGFTDELVKTSQTGGHFKKKEQQWEDLLLPNYSLNFDDQFNARPWRITALYLICLILFFVSFIRLFHLQIVKGEENRQLAEGNRIQIKVIHAPRGVIFDRNGKILAANSPAFRLYDASSKKAKLIRREQALEMEVGLPPEGKQDPRSDQLEVDNVRSYPQGEKIAHVIGYVGQISEDQLKDSRYKGYRAGDRIGQSGLEAQYEKVLRGIDGGEIIEVDSKGKKLRVLRTNQPIAGQNITLTIDSDLQTRAYQQMKEALVKADSCCGAAVAMDPNTGQVLALVSLPTFDPNQFSVEDDNAISEIFSNPSSPILNRVITGTYPPGSTYKIISSLAALDSGKIDKNTTIIDNGAIYLGTFKFTNWYFTQYGRVEGAVNLLKALQRSNDIYFYEIGRMIGENALRDWSKKLRLGEKLNIDLPSEAEGLVPDDKWKRETFDVGWYPGDTLHMAIGQGFVLTTPLQVLGMTSYVASDGILYQPHLILSEKSKILVSNLISKDKLNLVKQGLDLVPKDGGTAWPFFTFPIPTSGKTGTSEYGEPSGKTHAWYTSYAPATDPKIAITVLVEGGGEGSSVASPIVKEIYRWYFSEDKNKLIQDTYSIATESARTLGE